MTPAQNAINILRTGVKAKDPILVGKAVDTLRLNGYNYRQCYRVAHALDSTLTEGEWDDLLAQADEA